MKKTISIILALALCLGAGAVPAVAVNPTVEHAYDLYDLGLFQGTDTGFELDKRPTRIEGLTMFVRLLGGEREAIQNDYAHPFSDVPAWGDPYVGYAWEYGLTNGVGEGRFGSTAYISLEEYVTLVLRALHYDDARGDFSWNTSVSKAVEVGLLDRSEADRLESSVTTRGTMVDISYAALRAQFSDESSTLAEKMVADGAMARETAVAKGIIKYQGEAERPAATERPGTVRPSASPSPKPSAAPSPQPSETPSPAPVHTSHSWSVRWSSSDTHHWHECVAGGAPGWLTARRAAMAPTATPATRMRPAMSAAMCGRWSLPSLLSPPATADGKRMTPAGPAPPSARTPLATRAAWWSA